MNRERVLSLLREHESQLRQAGISRLWLFGSTARGQASTDSDVDLLAAFDEARKLSLLDVVHLENQLGDLLGCKVDLAEEGQLRSNVQQEIRDEIIRAF